jgi:uncharacterized protein (TIGR00299 family) protein
MEPLAGAAGDMILAALIDLGADPAAITAILQESGLAGVELAFSRAKCRHGIMCGYLRVLENGADADDHGHAHSHSEGHDHGHAHSPGEGHAHGHAHSHSEGHDHGHDLVHTPGDACVHTHDRISSQHEGGVAEPDHVHVHRGLSDILSLIHGSGAAARAKARAEKIFRRLAAAEAAIHGVSPDEVHFHEVGAVDSIADIFGICLALEQLSIDVVYCSGYKIGHGTVRCAHGVMPVPAPATAKLLEGYPVTRLPIMGELTTPTGAAVLTALSEGALPPQPMNLVATGYGHGRKEFELMPNVVRALLFEQTDGDTGLQTDVVAVISFEVDDMSPEALAYLQERSMAAGALDVSFIAVQMKKNRPGTQVRMLTRSADAQRLATLALRESSTLGVRISEERRWVLSRQAESIQTPWGALRCKRVMRPGGSSELVPEYDSARELAVASGRPLRQIMDKARSWHGDGEAR